jgi:4-alpha-glucanotransferase
MSSEWMDMKECAEVLGVVPKTVREMLAKDGVPVMRLPGKWQVKRSDFGALVARRYKV